MARTPTSQGEHPETKPSAMQVRILQISFRFWFLTSNIHCQASGSRTEPQTRDVAAPSPAMQQDRTLSNTGAYSTHFISFFAINTYESLHSIRKREAAANT